MPGWRALTFRGRLTLVAAAAVAVTTIAASVATYFFVQGQLIGEVDNSLRDISTMAAVQTAPGGGFGVSASGVRAGAAVGLPPPSQLGGAQGYFQVVNGSGQRTLKRGETIYLPANQQDLAVANGSSPPYIHDERVGGVHVRILTTRLTDGTALQVARPMEEIDNTMAALRLLLIAVAVGGVLLAALLGRLVARAALAPVQRLSEAVDHVTATGDLTRHVPDAGTDELGRLGANFNRMLDALRHSLKSQRELVADASHELRTPLASMRTNVEVLERAPRLPAVERKQLVRDLVLQSERLSRLVHDLIDLARDDQPLETVGAVQLDVLVGQAVERAASRWPAVRFVEDARPTEVTGESDRIERAVANLLDNAGKWSPAGEVVEVGVGEGEVTVRDHGPGIDPRDVPRVFDRFWRAAAARSLPGSGLGLAIVKQVAEAHGATIAVESPEGGGALMRLRFPEATPARPDS